MTNKKVDEYKAPCEMLGRILTVKKLNKKQKLYVLLMLVKLLLQDGVNQQDKLQKKLV